MSHIEFVLHYIAAFGSIWGSLVLLILALRWADQAARTMPPNREIQRRSRWLMGSSFVWAVLAGMFFSL